MRILIIGSGGREHTLVWKIAQSKGVKEIYVAPGNAGTQLEGKKNKNIKIENVSIKVDAIDELVNCAKEKKIDLTVVGPEIPLVNGIVDAFEKEDLRIFGPNQKAAQLEGSKIFAKQIMAKYDIPTAAFKECYALEEAKKYLETQNFPTVIKADGLAAGKGVIIVQNKEEGMKTLESFFIDNKFGEAGQKVVIEEFLAGEEASILAFCDSKTIMAMESSQDHKAIYDGDKGPNTGGMGAYSPAPIVTDEMKQKIQEQIFDRLLKAFQGEGITYKGIAYAGLMIINNEPKVIEFNVRFGDPETQVILPRLKNDLVEIMNTCIDEKLSTIKLKWDQQHFVTVVGAAPGYPGSYPKGLQIDGLNQLLEKNEIIFHAGTKYEEDKIVTSGGRVLNFTASGKDLKQAIDNAYTLTKKVSFKDMYYRKDIGKKGLLKITSPN
ncbi:phosphoribosylamine--glycine ligase [Candidatus Margulisiibacteriota bacterium]